MSFEAAESKFVSTFIVWEKRDRYLQLLANPKRRKDILRQLYHGLDYVPEFATSVKSTVHQAELIVEELRGKGAGAECYAMSPDKEIDGQVLPLAAAVEDIERHDGVAVLICVPDRLAYYKGELCRIILSR